MEVAMSKVQFTTIWRQKPDGLSQVAEYPGLPFGVLNYGDVVNVPGQGQARCDGKATSGSGNNEVVTELRLTLI